MVQWIYILKCSNNDEEEDIYYVGQTRRLFTRFWEHSSEEGGCLNTMIYEPYELVCIYRVNTIGSFFDYDNHINFVNMPIDNINKHETLKYNINKLQFFDTDKNYHDERQAENNIAECMMLHNEDNWKNIRGGKYTRFDCKYKYPTDISLKNLPLCKCGVPCNIKKKRDKNELYFTCANKNIWGKLSDSIDLDIPDPCDFYKKYTNDKDFILQEEHNKQELKELFRISKWLENVPTHKQMSGNETHFTAYCIGPGQDEEGGGLCCKYKDFHMLSYAGFKRCLCFDCFKIYNTGLQERYSITDCLL